MFALDAAYDQNPCFILCFCLDFDDTGIVPQSLGLAEVNPMFFQINLTFPFVELKSKHGIKNIPLLDLVQALVFEA